MSTAVVPVNDWSADGAPLISAWAPGAEPPPLFTVSEWADAHRQLPEASGAKGGRWRTDATPYLRGIMDAVHEPGVRKIALMKSAQVGGPLTLDTPIPTPDGWTTMGAIALGDRVFDERGVPCRVIGVSDVLTGRPTYRLHFSDGTYLDSDGEHLWPVESATSFALASGQLGRPKGSAGVGATKTGLRSTDQIRQSVMWRGRTRHAIRVARPLDLPVAQLPVDPYVLGVWLGDGHSYSPSITQGRRDVEELIGHLRTSGLQPEIIGWNPTRSAATVALEPRRRSDPRCIRGHVLAEVGRTTRGHCAECHRQQSKKTMYGFAMDPVTTLASKLIAIGLLSGSRPTARGRRKHIPMAYLRASMSQRLNLLQGLMDTDGTCTPRGHAEFSTSSARLRDDVLDLLRGLGLKPTVRCAPPRVKRGTNYKSRPNFRIGFTADPALPVFKLSRKLARLSRDVARRPSQTGRRRIVKVDAIESAPVRCIAVDSPSHLFLAGRAMIPTHNSESLHNILGYYMAYDPCAMLFVHPTVEVAEEWSKDRLADMLRTTEALRQLVTEKREGPAALATQSTLAYKVFPGGFLALGGANTPNTFARRAVRIVFADDVDRFPAVVGEEGDPADLLEPRVETFLDGLIFFVSTPTLAKGRIDTLYQFSDQRRYHVTCPTCGREDWITWSDGKHFRIVFEEHADSARLACPDVDYGGCEARHDEATRRDMVSGGRWLPTAVAKEVGLVGFHLPAMVSTLGSVTLQRLVEKFQTSRAKGKESLRVFINTTLGEGWEDRGARMDPQALMSRREDYGPDVEVPAWAVALTAGVDVQDNRFEVLVMAWGLADERAVVDWRTIPGDPKLPETRARLADALSRKYTHAFGPDLPIHVTCIDTGYATEEMYDFVLQHQVRRVFATKGWAGKSGEPIVGKPSEKKYGRNPRPVRLYPINVDDAKAELMNALTMRAPGPGSLHFPLHLEAVGEEFFAQLCAEHRETRYNKAGVATHSVWVQDRDRNEALDCAVLCRAAFRLLNPNIRQMLEAVRAAGDRRGPSLTPAPSATTVTDPVPPPAPPAPAPRGRRVSRSRYLSS